MQCIIIMVNIKQISPTIANNYLQELALLIDLREGDAVESLSYAVPFVDNFAYSFFEQIYTEIPKNRVLIFGCESGLQSPLAAQFLVAKGWNPDHIFSLEGGMEAWKREGFPTKKIERGFTMGKTSFTQSVDGTDAY